jgi:hypothetical protein
MKKRAIIGMKQLNRAIYDVQLELGKLGLWNEGSLLAEINIYACPIPRIDVRGLFYHGDNLLSRVLGFYEGEMYIPLFSLAHLSNTKNNSLRDVIRHEYAHAFAHQYPELIFTQKFSNVFGGTYNDFTSSLMPAESYISDYAKTMPMEDFAETFMFYLKHKGKITAKFSNKKLIAKWNFIAKIIKALSL